MYRICWKSPNLNHFDIKQSKNKISTLNFHFLSDFSYSNLQANQKGFNRQLIGDGYSSSLLARQQNLKRFPALVSTLARMVWGNFFGKNLLDFGESWPLPGWFGALLSEMKCQRDWWLILIDADWFWLMLVNADWCLLILINLIYPDWWWLILIDSGSGTLFCIPFRCIPI